MRECFPLLYYCIDLESFHFYLDFIESMNNLNSKAVIFEWTDADNLYQTKIYKSQTRFKLIEISENKKKELIVTAFSASDKQQAWIEHDNVSCPRFIIRLRIVETRFTIRFVRIRDSPRRINFVRSSSVGQCFLHWMGQRDWYTPSERLVPR